MDGSLTIKDEKKLLTQFACDRGLLLDPCRTGRRVSMANIERGISKRHPHQIIARQQTIEQIGSAGGGIRGADSRSAGAADGSQLDLGTFQRVVVSRKDLHPELC